MAEFLFTAAGQIIHSSGSTVSGGIFSISSSPSLKLLVNGQGVYRGPLTVSFSGGNMTGMTPGSVSGIGSISPTSLKNKTESLYVLRNGDSGSLVGTAIPTAGPPAVPVSIPCECSSSQNKVKGN